jgi:hypothetical protein
MNALTPDVMESPFFAVVVIGTISSSLAAVLDEPLPLLLLPSLPFTTLTLSSFTGNVATATADSNALATMARSMIVDHTPYLFVCALIAIDDGGAWTRDRGHTKKLKGSRNFRQNCHLNTEFFSLLSSSHHAKFGPRGFALFQASLWTKLPSKGGKVEGIRSSINLYLY